MPIKDYHEQQFFNALREIFVGAKIEGDSGFINLMQIKSRYYMEGVFPQLKGDIDAAVADFPEFREELFDKLYTFFKRYFSESGSIYFRYTPLHQRIYEQVYTDDRDVVLFWKTHMLYYVKTDRIFQNLTVEVDGVQFFFDASQIEHKRANEKRDVIFSFREVRPDGALVFEAAYSTHGKITKIDKILKTLRKADREEVSDETLEKAFRVFEKQAEVDYFINKNARAFLEEQFELWMYQYLFEGQDVWSAERLAQLQALKTIAFKVIGFISQFEDELVKIWNKPKFVRDSHYVLTLDHLLGDGHGALLEQVFEAPGMADQIAEWVDLGMLDQAPDPVDLLGKLTRKNLLGETTVETLQYLPLDTRHFPELERDLLSIFDDLDAELDGWVVHSENYQALNTLLAKYQDKTQSIYIDPPYNANSSEISYENTFKHSSWLSLMENRIELSKDYLNKSAVFICAIDEIEQESLGHLLKILFPNSEITSVVVIHNATGQQGNNFSSTNEFAYFVYPKDGIYIGLENRKDNPDVRPLRNVSKGSHLRKDAKNCFYPIYLREGKIVGFGNVCEDNFHPGNINIRKPDGIVEVYPIDNSGTERKWVFARDSVESILDELQPKYFPDKDCWDIIRTKTRFNYKTVWTSSKYSANSYGSRILNEMIPNNNFSFPKSLFTVADSLDAGLNNQKFGLILDYFAGSGTTAHAVMNLNREDGGQRKYLLVEMGDHFQTVILPRIKKVAFCSKWKDGRPVFDAGEGGMRHCFKYYALESYEETLSRAHYQDADLFHDPARDPYHAYVFLADRKLLDAVDADPDADKVRFHPERLYPDIDLAETLSHLKGKWIRRITADFVTFEDGERMSLTDPDWPTLKPMVWWQ